MHKKVSKTMYKNSNVNRLYLTTLASFFLFLVLFEVELVYAQKLFEVDQDAPAAPAGMVYIPTGAFIMGSDIGDKDECPRREESTTAYFIDIYEVTNQQDQKFDLNWSFAENKKNCPALVTWEQAAAYAKWAGKRLPTEKEWEKAARGTDGRLYPWGNIWDIAMAAWNDAEPVGSNLLCISPYGCYDMAGNVWEWTEDWYLPYPGNKIPCEAYGRKFKVIRGGAAFNDCSFMRCAKRYYVDPKTKISGYKIGFRCVKDL
jgi:formylglycine-generating enzyme required for sulfatase activity